MSLKLIHKYKLAVELCQNIEMPEGSRILSVQEQDGELTMWAEFAKNNQMRKIQKTIVIQGTGMVFEDHDQLEYLATVQIQAMVWHVYVEV